MNRETKPQDKTEQARQTGQAGQAEQAGQDAQNKPDQQESHDIPENQSASENHAGDTDPLAEIGRDIDRPPLVDGDAPAPEVAKATAEATAKPKKPTAEEQLADLNDKFLRLAAELENTRRRAGRDRAEALKYGVAGFARDMVAVGDNLTRALTSIDETSRQNWPDHALNLLEGVAATQRDLIAALERHSIKQMTPLGEKFDPNLHEAMFEAALPDKENGTIIEVVETGFMIGDRLLRAAKVGVVKNTAQPTPETPPDTDDS